MNGLPSGIIPPVLKDNSLEEIKDEDLPVLPYKSKDKRTHFYVNEKLEKELKNNNSIDLIEKVSNKDVTQTENNINKNINEVKESMKENINQIEQTEKKDENMVQVDKSKGIESEIKVETEKKLKEERKPDYSLFDKEYNKTFPLSRPEDSN